ncbi:hypothetical protein ING2D1G_1490 [Peptoniphilus sp. ING2-D1G]|nr:hypothetical protein ING2D1G_1490 [Peptoniphilus sp. ING2-D1G]
MKTDTRVRTRTMTGSSLLPGSKTEVFTKLLDINTLKYIAKPMMSFEAVKDFNSFTDDNFSWAEGKIYKFQLKIFGIIPLGVHTIKVIDFNRENYKIYTHEGNPLVPVWNHRIILKEVDSNTILYTDEVELYAGWKTCFIYLWSKIFYAHRQRRWLKLLEKID